MGIGKVECVSGHIFYSSYRRGEDFDRAFAQMNNGKMSYGRIYIIDK